MAEKEPIPIARGVEILKVAVERIQKRAIITYRQLATLDQKIDEKISTALSQPPELGTPMLAEAFSTKHDLEAIGHELEELILESFKRQDTLEEKWTSLELRIEEIKPKLS